MDELTDIDLIARAQKRNLPALTAIYDRYNQAIYYYALRMLGDPLQAEDCVAETFSRLLKAFHLGRGPSENIKAYLFRSAHNWITDQYRRQPIIPLELNDEIPEINRQTPVELAENNIDRQKIQRALGQITNEQREVVTLRFVEGWEIEEIATCLQKPIGAVKALQHRAIMGLRKLLLADQQDEM
jgi:RNA polymerase sigma-70 factor (ECF subfamily)